MGCWNGTCALSNLSIHAGEKAYLILLVRTSNETRHMGGGFCYTRLDYSPIFVPLLGEYDDYGAIENIVEGPHTEALLKYFSDPNNYRIVSRKFDKESMPDHHPPFDSIKKLINSIERGFVRIKQQVIRDKKDPYFTPEGDLSEDHRFSCFNEWVDVGFMLIHASIFDSIVRNTCLPIDEQKIEELKQSRPVERLHHYLFPSICSDVNFLGYETDVFENTLLMGKLEWALMGLHKFYNIQAGAGSQDDNSDNLVNLFKETRKVIAERKRRYRQ